MGPALIINITTTREKSRGMKKVPPPNLGRMAPQNIFLSRFPKNSKVRLLLVQLLARLLAGAEVASVRNQKRDRRNASFGALPRCCGSARKTPNRPGGRRSRVQRLARTELCKEQIGNLLKGQRKLKVY